MIAWLNWLAGCVCHLDDGSFAAAVGGNVAFCARCSGVYVGVIAGLAFALLARRGKASLPPVWLLAVQIASLAAMAVAGFGSLYGVIELSVWAKFAVGSAFGQTLGCFAGEVIKHWSERCVAQRWARLEAAAYLVLSVCVACLPLLGQRAPFLWLFIAIASASGLVAGLCSANLLLAKALARGKGWRGRWSAARVPLVVVACAAELLVLRAWRWWWVP
jgi:uncharacterized membrane protein